MHKLAKAANVSHEPQIEPWLPQKHCPACRVFRTRRHHDHQQWNSREWTTSRTSPEKWNCSGLDLEKESLSPVEVEVFSW